MDQKQYTKIRDLVGKAFSVERVFGYQWVKWDEATRKMSRADTYFEGAQMQWGLLTTEGILNLSRRQYSDMLLATEQKGEAVIPGQSFLVTSKTGANDITYYNFRVLAPEVAQAKQSQAPQQDLLPTDEEVEAPVQIDEIPF